MIGDGLLVPDDPGRGSGAVLGRDHDRVRVAVEADVAEEVEEVWVGIGSLLLGQAGGDGGEGFGRRRHDRGFSALAWFGKWGGVRQEPEMRCECDCIRATASYIVGPTCSDY